MDGVSVQFHSLSKAELPPPPVRLRPGEEMPSPETPGPETPLLENVQEVEVAGHRLTVFVESPPLLDAIVRDIEQARSRVWVEVYIFYNDAGGSRVAEALKQKAREGVDVRVLYDALGSAATPSAFFNEMIVAGVKVHAFHSILEGLRRFRPLTLLNRRDHRKLIVIDSSVGYFGGMNLIDNVEDVHQQKAEDRPTSSGWRDVHVRLEGPQQYDLAQSFDRSWRRAHGEKISRQSRSYRRALHLTAGNGNGQTETIRFFDSGPGKKFSRASRVFTHLIRGARHQITLSMAYFLPVGQTLRALIAARHRGVRIRVIVPGKSDVRIVQRATSYLYEKLIRRGFGIYERRERMLHSKTMVVDGQYTIVGSCNLDPRSLFINLEFIAVIRSRKFAEALARICRYEMEHSDRITMACCERVPRLQRLENRLAWAVRWWL